RLGSWAARLSAWVIRPESGALAFRGGRLAFRGASFASRGEPSAPDLGYPPFGVGGPPRGASRARRICRRGLGCGPGSTPAPEQRVEAVVAAALGRDKQEDEAEQDGGYPLVLQGPSAVRRVELPVRDRHLAREDEGHRPGAETEQDQNAAEEFED